MNSRIDEEKVTRGLTALAEAKIPADQVDLWPAVQERAAIQRPAPRQFPISKVAWALAGVIVAMLGLVLVPRLRSGNPYDGAAADFENRQDYGVKPIYANNLQTDLEGITQTVQDVTVMIEWVYVDPVRLIIASDTASTFQGGGEIKSIVDAETGIEFIRAVNASGMEAGSRSNRRIETFYVPVSLMRASRLNLIVNFYVSRGNYPAGWFETPGATLQPPDYEILYGETTFNITVPMTNGRIFEPNQTVEASGVPITLERLIIAPSASRADVCYDPPSTEAFPDWRIRMSVDPKERTMLSTGEQTIYERYSNFSLVDPVGWITKTPGRTCTGIWLLDTLPLDGDLYTLTIQSLDGIPPDAVGDYTWLEGPWVWELRE